MQRNGAAPVFGFFFCFYFWVSFFFIAVFAPLQEAVSGAETILPPPAAPSRPRSKPSRSLRQAIDDKCRECIVNPLSGMGNWRQQVTACTSRTCPLYPVRPLSESRC